MQPIIFSFNCLPPASELYRTPKLLHVDFSFSHSRPFHKAFGHRKESQIWTEKASSKQNQQISFMVSHILLNWHSCYCSTFDLMLHFPHFGRKPCSSGSGNSWDANLSDNTKKQYIKWCKGCANDFSFRTGCGLRNELRTAAVQQAQDLQPTDPSIPRERRPKNCNLAGHVLHSVNRKIIIV